MQYNVRMFFHSLGNTSRHFRAVERPLSGRGSVDQSEATEHWRFPGLFRVMRFISSRNTNGPENQVVHKDCPSCICLVAMLPRLLAPNLVPRADFVRFPISFPEHTLPRSVFLVNCSFFLQRQPLILSFLSDLAFIHIAFIRFGCGKMNEQFRASKILPPENI